MEMKTKKHPQDPSRCSARLMPLLELALLLDPGVGLFGFSLSTINDLFLGLPLPSYSYQAVGACDRPPSSAAHGLVSSSPELKP